MGASKKRKRPAAKRSKATKPKARKAASPAKSETKRMSALDAAAQVLATTGKPMRSQDLIAAMAEQNLWKSPGGKTPSATLYVGMMNEERKRGKASRFTKVDRGQFAFNKGAK
jgi:hypothetical protein